MNKKALISILILIFCTAVAAGSIFLFVKQDYSSLSVLSPISKTFSLFNFTKERVPPEKIIYGYLPYWSLEEIKYIQLDKITDIAYFGLNIDDQGNFIAKDDDGNISPGLNVWRNSKILKDFIKVCNSKGVNFALTIISHNDGVSDKFLDCKSCWDNLIENVTEELIKYDIKDVNLNFEYVELTPKEKAMQYTEFVDYFNVKLDKIFGNSKVTVATFADSIVKDRVTDIESLGKVADEIFIMAYDFHRPTSDNAGPVSPIGGIDVYAEYDIETMLKDYLSRVPPNKLLLGVPYYGYNWVVEEDSEYAKRIEGQDDIGYSQSQTYEAVKETILKVKPEVKWDDLAKTPYFTYKSPETGSIREVYFDDVESLRVKYRLVKDNNMAGVGIWALGYDGGYRELWDLLGEEFIKQ